MKSQNTTEKKEPKRKDYRNIYIAISPSASPFNANYWRDARISYMVNKNNWIWNLQTFRCIGGHYDGHLLWTCYCKRKPCVYHKIPWITSIGKCKSQDAWQRCQSSWVWNYQLQCWWHIQLYLASLSKRHTSFHHI